MKKTVTRIIELLMISALLLTGCKKTGDAYSNDPDGTSNLTGTGTMYAGNGSTGGELEGEDSSSEQQVEGTVTDDQTANSQNAEGQENGEDANNSNGVSEGDQDESVLPEWMLDIQNTMELSVMIVNLCGVDIGMVSILDPYTGEQIDIGALPADQILNVTEPWPKDKTIFDIAIYNIYGDLVATSEIDITGIQNSITITFSGDGDLEKVESKID